MISISFKTLSDRSKNGSTAPARSGIHSGNGGDVLYSLPSVRALGVRHLILNVYRARDPNRKLTEEMAEGLVPLLLAQEYIDRVTVVTAGVPLERVEPGCIGVDCILDRFRNENFADMHLMHAHARAVGADIDPNEPFLSVPDNASNDTPDVVICLTPRYRGLTEEFVRELGLYFDNVVAVGIPEEWRSVAGFDGPVRRFDNFLQLAQVIQQARLFIGNPSLCSAIAEGLKVPRVVDLPSVGNAFPIGPRGYILPTRRADFVDIVHRLCPENEVINVLYADLTSAVQQLTTENDKLRRLARTVASSLDELGPASGPTVRDSVSLMREAERGHVVLGGGSDTKVDLETQGIYLHPGPPGSSEASARFLKVNLNGYNVFRSDILVDNEHSQPVCFLFRLYDENGELVFETSRELSGATKTKWRVPFEPIPGTATLELSAKMGDSATSNEFAWAWFRDPQLRTG